MTVSNTTSASAQNEPLFTLPESTREQISELTHELSCISIALNELQGNIHIQGANRWLLRQLDLRIVELDEAIISAEEVQA